MVPGVRSKVPGVMSMVSTTNLYAIPLLVDRAWLVTPPVLHTPWLPAVLPEGYMLQHPSQLEVPGGPYGLRVHATGYSSTYYYYMY